MLHGLLLGCCLIRRYGGWQRRLDRGNAYDSGPFAIRSQAELPAAAQRAVDLNESLSDLSLRIGQSLLAVDQLLLQKDDAVVIDKSAPVLSDSFRESLQLSPDRFGLIFRTFPSTQES